MQTQKREERTSLKTKIFLCFSTTCTKQQNFSHFFACETEKSCTFAVSKTTGLVAQLDRVPDYGSGGCGFDSRLVHKGSTKRTFFLAHSTSGQVVSFSHLKQRFDSAMGYKNNPQLVQNQAADFLLPQICPNWYDYSLFFLNLAHEINHK